MSYSDVNQIPLTLTNTRNFTANNHVQVANDPLDVTAHIAYNQGRHDHTVQRRIVLELIKVLSQIRQNGRGAALAAAHATTLLNDIFPGINRAFASNKEALALIHSLQSNFQAINAFDTTFLTDNLIFFLVRKLLHNHEPGPRNEIVAANALIKAYMGITVEEETNIKTEPASPIATERPLPMRPRTTDIISDKENIDPNNRVSNIHDDEINEDVEHLKRYLYRTPTYSIPMKFTMPEGYSFKESNTPFPTAYFKLILSALLMKNAKEGAYKGQNLEYAQVGPDNAAHFIGFSDVTHNWIIADTKKKLFGKMTD